MAQAARHSNYQIMGDHIKNLELLKAKLKLFYLNN